MLTMTDKILKNYYLYFFRIFMLKLSFSDEIILLATMFRLITNNFLVLFHLSNYLFPLFIRKS